MSATMSVNPAFTDGNSNISGDIPTDDDLPPSYESIANVNCETLQGISGNVTSSQGQDDEEPKSEGQSPNQSLVLASNSGSAESPTNIATEESASIPPSFSSPEPFYEPSGAINDEGRYI